MQSVRASADAPIYVWRSDLGALTVWDGNSWNSQSLVLGSYQVSGSPPYRAKPPVLGANFLIKTGELANSTETAFGNGYLQYVTFSTPFPNDCLVVVCQPYYYNGSPYSFSDSTPVQLDNKTRSGFRAMYVGEASAKTHSIGWIAIGF